MNKTNKYLKRLCILLPGHWSDIMGGSQYQAKCIIEELAKTQRYDIVYLTRHCNPDYREENYRLVRYQYPFYRSRGSHRHIFEYAMLPKILRKIEPDIIYQRVGCAQTGIAAKYARKNGCKIIWHIASEFDLIPSRIRISRLFIYRRIERYLLNYGIKNASHIIAQTDDQAKLLEQNFDRRVSAVIPNLHPAPRENIEKKNPVKVVWVANLKEIKQPKIFIRLCTELQEMPNVEFLMIGAMQHNSRTKDLYLNLMAKARKLKYLGPMSQEDVNATLAKSHIFVSTSKREGFPNTYIQAWMRKVPVVSLTVDPDRLIMRHSLGFVSGTFDKMKDDIRNLLANEELRITLGNNAKTFADRYFSTKNAQKIADVIEDAD